MKLVVFCCNLESLTNGIENVCSMHNDTCTHLRLGESNMYACAVDREFPMANVCWTNSSVETRSNVGGRAEFEVSNNYIFNHYS